MSGKGIREENSPFKSYTLGEKRKNMFGGVHLTRKVRKYLTIEGRKIIILEVYHD